jgi:CheY-like chemotaxis protein
VDDDRDTLNLLETFLDLAGFDVTTAADGADALRKASAGFDVITTDLAMPCMDGCELIQRLHDLPVAPTPVVVVTSQAADRSLRRRVQPCRILSKSCELEELVQTLQSLLTTCSYDRFRCSTCPSSPRRAPKVA